RGDTGMTGAQGATLVGPAGVAGGVGQTGGQGVIGSAGPQGVVLAGRAGPAGPAGIAGPQGVSGQTGAQGVIGAIPGWSSYRDVTFGYNGAELQPANHATFREIATYMARNPSLVIGIDGTMDPRGTDPRNQALAEQRVQAVRNGLITAGVPSSQIAVGAFGDASQRRPPRVEILVNSS
ncbi:MAG: OmpA family protein, partial [Ferrovibrio sp.]